MSLDPSTVAEPDPFELFDRATGAEDCRNPYPEFAEARRRSPFRRVDLGAAAVADVEPAVAQQMPELYEALSYEAVAHVLRDGRAFSSAKLAESMGVVMGPTILVMDPPEHGRYRSLIQTAFKKKALARWGSELVAPVVHRLIDGFAERGRADLVRELAFPFPVNVIAGMLGLPERDLPRFHRLAVQLISVAFDWEQGLAASKELALYLTPFIAARREAPRDDLISVLAQAELDGHRLDDGHILGFLRLLLPAGAETTYRSSSNLLFGLLTHPDQLEAVRADRSLVPQAIEEGLRWEAPLTGIVRFCIRDTEVAGVPVPAGATVAVNLGSANHDEARWEDPEAFDVFRPRRQHIAFGFGAHRCLGMELARIETDVMLNAVLDRLPNLRLDPAAEDVHITGRAFRAPRRLPVLFG